MMPEGSQSAVVPSIIEQQTAKIGILDRADKALDPLRRVSGRAAVLTTEALLFAIVATSGQGHIDAKDLTPLQPVAEVNESLSVEERESLKQEVDTVISTIKKFIKPEFLERSKINLDEIASNFTKDDAGLVDWRKHRNLIQRPDGGRELSTIIPNTSMSATVSMDQTKQIDYQSVRFKTDPEITSILDNASDSSRDFKTPFTLEDLKGMPAKLSTASALILPEGRKENLPIYFHWVAPLPLDVTSKTGKLTDENFIYTPPGSGYRTFDGKEYGASIAAEDNGVIQINVNSQASK